MSKLEEEQSVLEGLDQIEWHTLEHAYGEADDVPTLLQDGASQHEEASGTALETLSLSTCHQGTIYSASAYLYPSSLNSSPARSLPVKITSRSSLLIWPKAMSAIDNI
jgi:hypothetical protein